MFGEFWSNTQNISCTSLSTAFSILYPCHLQFIKSSVNFSDEADQCYILPGLNVLIIIIYFILFHPNFDQLRLSHQWLNLQEMSSAVQLPPVLQHIASKPCNRRIYELITLSWKVWLTTCFPQWIYRGVYKLKWGELWWLCLGINSSQLALRLDVFERGLGCKK